MFRHMPAVTLFLFSMSAFAQDKGIKIAFQLNNNHIYLQGAFNDSLPAWILLDCGAVTIVSERLAKKATINTKPFGNTAGIGNNTSPVQLTDSASFTFGALRYVEKNIPVISLNEVEGCAAQISVEKNGKIGLLKGQRKSIQPIDAVLGDKFFRRFVVEIDFQKNMLTLHEPGSYLYSGNGQHVPLEYSDNHIYTMASVRVSGSLSMPGRFMVDCGSMTGVILSTPFIKQQNLRPPADAKEISLCGIGGSSSSMMGTLDDLQIGEYKIKKPVTLFSEAIGGVLTRTDIAGLIGNGILRNFRVIFDYSRREMILEK